MWVCYNPLSPTDLKLLDLLLLFFKCSLRPRISMSRPNYKEKKDQTQIDGHARKYLTASAQRG